MKINYLKSVLTLLFCIASTFIYSNEIPASFIPNKGQFRYFEGSQNDILYYYTSGDIQVLFKQTSITYILKSNNKSNLALYNAIADTNEALGQKLYLEDSSFYYRMDILFQNSSNSSTVEGNSNASFYYNYYLGEHIRTTKVVPSSEIIYKNIYPGIDIKFYAKNNGIKYDFIIHPEGDVNDIRLEYIGAEISTENNELKIKTPIKTWFENIPKSFILENNKDIDVQYLINKNTISFSASNYDQNSTLIIDPDLTWSTYYNAKQEFNYIYQSLDAYNNEVILATRVDATFIPYLIAGTGAYFKNTIGGSNDFLLLKFNSTGQITWATYFGSSGSESFKGGIKFDKTGRIYFLSANSNNDMPTLNLAGAYNGSRSSSGTSSDDMHISRFSNSGTLEWASWIPCDYYHEAADIAIGPNNNVYIAGHFGSSYKFGSAFPFVNPGGGAYFQSTRTMFPTGYSSLYNHEAFIIQFNTNCSIVWSTYFGDLGNEKINKITVTPNGSIFLSGIGSSEYKRPKASDPYQYYNAALKTAGQFFDDDHQSGKNKLYFVKFNPDRSWAWASYFGNKSGINQSYNQSNGYSLLTDSKNNIYVVDGTTDPNMPIQNLAGAYNQNNFATNHNATKLYIVKFANTTKLTWSTYFSGQQTNGYWRIGAFVDFDDELYVVAGTQNSDHPITVSSPGFNQNAIPANGKDGILARFSSTGALVWSTFFGGFYFDEEVKQVAVTGVRGCATKDIFITGRTGGTSGSPGTNSWPVVNPGGGAHIENFPGSGYYHIGIARFTDSPLPQTLALHNDSRTCPCSGNSFTHFIPSGTNRIIASINPNGQNLGNTTVTAYVQPAAVIVNDCNNTSPNFQTAVMGRRFKITPTTQPSSNVSVRLYFSATEFSNLSSASTNTTTANPNDNISAMSALKATRFSASAGNSAYENGNFPDNCGRGNFYLYNNVGTGYVTSLFTGFDANGHYAEFSVPGFSEMWLHGKIDNSPLPVELFSFSAACLENRIRINWTTVSEQNNAYFQIDKSLDGENWNLEKRISGAGNSNNYLQYEVQDFDPNNGTTLYRLSQIDYDGTVTYFEPYSVTCTSSSSNMEVYPNPANAATTIAIQVMESATNAYLQITDAAGKTIFTQKINLSNGLNQFTIPTDHWADGIYVIRVIHDQLTIPAQKLLIRK